MHDSNRIDTVEGLRTLYRNPSALVVHKERPQLDEASQQFVSRCRFAAVGTFDADGNPDVSPRGGPSGFVRVLDPGHLAIADLGGNNRLDTLQNVVATGRVALLLVMPGKSETVRVNGRAWVSADPNLLAGFTLPKVPKTAIVVEVQTTFVHCAKAFMRGGVWDTEAWTELADTPDGATILSCQQVADVDAATMRRLLDDGYVTELEAER
ncbi:MAG: MSMEG_1061 family FMN-dependent PPOX-type flavoprotein [Ilumatobacteraceae bacterium]